jgi:ribosomal protein S18 acetylase RimI-like enzyme
MIETLGPEAVSEIVDVLAEAFHDYPVMRFVLSDSQDYDDDLRTLIGFFAASRVHRNEPMLGERTEAGDLEGVALVSYPDRVSPPGVTEVREATWARLGALARARYEAFGAAAGSVEAPVPHTHLNMIGVRDAQRGTGLGRRLLEAVHEMSADDVASAGVSLTTENPRNVSLYRHFGYELLGERDVADAFTTWIMFRPDRS